MRSATPPRPAAGNELTDLELIEVSIVAWGANDRALVLRCNAGVKADQGRVVPPGSRAGNHGHLIHTAEFNANTRLILGFVMSVRWYPRGHFDKPDNTPSEFSHGRGLRPKHLLCAPPDEGGLYAAKCPPMAPQDRGKVRFGYAGRQVRA